MTQKEKAIEYANEVLASGRIPTNGDELIEFSEDYIIRLRINRDNVLTSYVFKNKNGIPSGKYVYRNLRKFELVF